MAHASHLLYFSFSFFFLFSSLDHSEVSSELNKVFPLILKQKNKKKTRKINVKKKRLNNRHVFMPLRG